MDSSECQSIKHRGEWERVSSDLTVLKQNAVIWAHFKLMCHFDEQINMLTSTFSSDLLIHFQPVLRLRVRWPHAAHRRVGNLCQFELPGELQGRLELHLADHSALWQGENDLTLLLGLRLLTVSHMLVGCNVTCQLFDWSTVQNRSKFYPISHNDTGSEQSKFNVILKS